MDPDRRQFMLYYERVDTKIHINLIFKTNAIQQAFNKLTRSIIILTILKICYAHSIILVMTDFITYMF